MGYTTIILTFGFPFPYQGLPRCKRTASLVYNKYLRAWLKKNQNGTEVRVISNVHIHISFHVLSIFDFIKWMFMICHSLPLWTLYDDTFMNRRQNIRPHLQCMDS